MNAPNLESALRYCEQGLSVVPVLPGQKEPAGQWKPSQYRPMGPDEIRETFTSQDNLNVGIVGGIPSQNLLVIDCDNMSKFRRDIRPRLRDIIANTWVVISGSRKRHVYVQIPFPVKCGKRPAWGVDLKAQGGYVVAPRSIFGETGGQYEFDMFTDEILRLGPDELGALDFLKLEPFDPANREEQSLLPFGVTWKIWAIVKGHYEAQGYAKGKHTPTDRSRSAADFHAMTWLADNGWTCEQVAELFRKHAGAGTKFREKTSRESYLRGTYHRAQEHARDHLTDEKRQLQAAISNIVSDSWPGRTGPTDRAVCLALLRIGYQAGGRTDVSASQRQVALHAGVEPPTVARSLERLIKGGLVGLIAKGTGFNASVFDIGSLVPKCCNTTTPGIVLLQHFDTGADAFRQSGIGKTGFDILQLIPATPDAIGLADLIARTDRSRRTVFRKLAKLKASGIVTTDAAGRLSRTSHDLESLARWLGTANTRDNKRRRYLEQRHAYREAIREMHAKVDPETGELGA